MWPAPDVIPELCRAIEECPDELWDSAVTLSDLADRFEPLLTANGTTRFDFVWQMERHFAEPFGPLPQATCAEFAGVPAMFTDGADLTTWHAAGYTPGSSRHQ